ncbi:hypothetical protein [Sphingomonas sp. Leaf412]|uniref:hypothetical protein n=1 Tax=Sphingomonas sp. Leaf412 TaxID=1736370 RepID=UPI0012E3EDAA|nr:hypothetical protein [Sphingomonas sp. Leaf412]
MVKAFRVIFLLAFLPVAAYALFFVSYALFNATYWLETSTVRANALLLGTLTLALAMGSFSFRRGMLEQNLVLAVLLLMAAVAELWFLIPTTNLSLGQL